jgi:hypothetical protein
VAAAGGRRSSPGLWVPGRRFGSDEGLEHATNDVEEGLEDSGSRCAE